MTEGTDETLPATPSGHEETRADTRVPPTGERVLAHIGELIDRYRINRQLGAGGMGVVYEAHDPELKREVAVKLLRKADSSGDLQARLLREAQAMAQVAHPNVITVYDVGTWRGEVFLAMELATGGTLRTWTKNKTPRQILDAYIAAGRGLAAAHAVGLVHRDFKPDNVLVGGDGRVRVTDFGLARSHDIPTAPVRPSQPLGDLTMTGAVLGTPAYMASELFAGTPADARTDQFAFCVALWESLYGTRPFAGNTMDEIADAVRSERIVDSPAKRRGSRKVERALRRGLAAKPDDRWPAMEPLLDELAPPARRTWIYVAAAGVLVVGTGVAIAAAMWPHPTTRIVSQAPADARADAVDPETAEAMKQIAALEQQIETLQKTGNLADVRRLEDQRVETARASKSRHLLAETLFGHASFLQATDANFAGAEKVLREGRRLAEALSDEPMKAKFAIELADVLDREGKHEEAADVRALAGAAASRPSSDDATRAASLEADAHSLTDIDQALAKWNEALVLRQKVGEPIAIAMNRIGAAQAQGGVDRYADARELLLGALKSLQGQTSSEAVIAKFGALGQLATFENQLEHWTDAEAHIREANALVETVPQLHGREDYMTLGTALLGKGDHKAAEEAFARSLKSDADVPYRHAQTSIMIGVAYFKRHDNKTAIAHAVDGVTEAEKALGADSGETLTYKLLLCKFLLADKQPARALPIAQEILPKIEKAEMGPLSVGDAQFALARALPKSQAAHAKELAKSALEELGKAGPVGADHATMVSEWLSKQ